MSGATRKMPIAVVNGESAPILYTTGVWGSVDGRGNMVLSFYHDLAKMPHDFIADVDDQGSMVGQHPVGSEITAVRNVVARVIVPRENLEELGHWLVDWATGATG